MKQIYLSIFFIFFLNLILISKSFAQELIDISYISIIENSDKQPTREEMIQNAILNVSLDNIRFLIGASKTESQMKLIQDRILTNSSRYILSLQSGAIQKKGSGFAMPVEMKLSLRNLRALLLDSGLLYAMDGPPRYVHFIRFDDKTSQRQWAWWLPVTTSAPQTGDFRQMLSRIQQLLRSGLAPVQFVLANPDNYQAAVQSPQTLEQIAESVKAQMIIEGSVVVSPFATNSACYQMDLYLKAIHSTNRRLLTDIQRQWVSEPSVSRSEIMKLFNQNIDRAISDFTTQVADSWRMGRFGTSPVRLSVFTTLSPQDIEQFKKNIPLKVRDIKNIQDRLIEARNYTFEADSSVLPQELASAFRSISWAPFRVQVRDVTEGRLSLEVTK